ncbi:hypothetical protein CPLU01_16005 [Colletotrichum plurivorum]|uniref:Uncharacterized protein n=1 Tax=Colletotrichum plurivorum TaxID=2175906 RepID=A0A8H6J2E4_9PEZI|nr:hypothetical protein CPLU01_16005 [Colletotrichum plurivorum]
MGSNHDQDTPDLKVYWPQIEPTPPSQWTVPLTMLAIGKVVAIQIPIQQQEWLTDNFPGMLDRLHDDMLSLDFSRFHLGALATDEWEDQWFQINCEPYFSYMPCALSDSEEVDYKRTAWIHDDGLTPLSERHSINFPPPFPASPPFVTFNGLVDIQKFPLSDDPSIGLDEITRNSSAVFKVWSKFTPTDMASTPKSGWCGNYVYAMLPNCKRHMKQKCEGLRRETTPFRKHGKKAYIIGYFHGFCNKTKVLSSDYAYNPLEFLPLIEIVKIDWAVGEPRGQPQSRDAPVTPSKGTTTGLGKKGFAFDPLAQMAADGRNPTTPSKHSMLAHSSS